MHTTFPTYLWGELLSQAFIPLNLLQKSRTCPKISVYAHLHGIYNFDTNPLSLPGVRALLYNDPNHRVSYGVHGDEAYYLGPALYIFFPLYIRNQNMCYCTIFPIDVSAPMLSPTTKILVAANELVNALKQP